MPAKLPYHKWFWADWFRDTRCLSTNARGVWVDLIGFLREHTATGSHTFDTEGWCAVLTCKPENWESALVEFKKFNICTLVDHGVGLVTVTSRRVKREKKERRQANLRQESYRESHDGDASVSNPSRPGETPKHSHSHSQKQSHSQRSEGEEQKEKRKSALTRRLSDAEFIESLKTNPAYGHINLADELGKMDAWLSTKPGRQKTRKFIVNWINKIDKPLAITGGIQSSQSAGIKAFLERGT